MSNSHDFETDPVFTKAKNEFHKWYGENKGKLERAKEFFSKLIEGLIMALVNNSEIESLPSNILSRLKTESESAIKFGKKYLNKTSNDDSQQEEYLIQDKVTDLIGIRIICCYEKEVEIISNMLCKQLELIDKKKGKTDKSKQLQEQNKFGYKGIHLDLKLDQTRANLEEAKEYKELRFEVQIRTIIQDAWSVLDHRIQYKQSVDAHLRRRINALAALFEIADREFESVHNIAKKATAQFREEHLSNETNAICSKKDEKTLAPFDAFACLNILGDMFPFYPFDDNSIYIFSEEILRCKPNTQVDDVITALNTYREPIEEYNQHLRRQGKNLNPYTEVRHMLYLSDKIDFKSLLEAYQTERFDNWYRDNYQT